VKSISYTSGELIFLLTDAFKVRTGAWVGQGPTPETAIPVSFHSQKFATIQLHYPMHELKLLALMDAVETFQPILYDTTFIIVINNKSLNYFMKQITIGKRLTR
jgi:hypothetical protein